MRSPGSFSNCDEPNVYDQPWAALGQKVSMVVETLTSPTPSFAPPPPKSNAGRRNSRQSMRTTANWSTEPEATDVVEDTSLQQRVANVVWSPEFETFAGFVIALNLVLLVWETDTRALVNVYANDPKSTADGALQRTLQDLRNIDAANLVFLCFYTVELVLRMGTSGWKFFLLLWNIIDFLVVIIGLLCEMLRAQFDQATLENMPLLRVMRMARLIRLSRFKLAFKEVNHLVRGLTSCMRTIFWAAALIFLTLTVWSIIAVEFVNPLLLAGTDNSSGVLYDRYDSGGCDWCVSGFRSVMFSNLTFFQIVTGDGWSHLARPLIEAHAWTSVIFLGVIFTVSFGLLNLIVAAIVDTAAQARESDLESVSKQRACDRREAWLTFKDLCLELDSDRSGDISMAELQVGLETNHTLQAYFSIMGVEEDDLREIFRLLDLDKSGDLSYKEFHNQLYKMKTLETKTTLYYILRHVQHLQRRFEKLEEATDSNMMPGIEKMRTDSAVGVCAPMTPPLTAHASRAFSEDAFAHTETPYDSEAKQEEKLPKVGSEELVGYPVILMDPRGDKFPRPGWYFYGTYPPPAQSAPQQQTQQPTSAITEAKPVLCGKLRSSAFASDDAAAPTLQTARLRAVRAAAAEAAASAAAAAMSAATGGMSDEAFAGVSIPHMGAATPKPDAGWEGENCGAEVPPVPSAASSPRSKSSTGTGSPLQPAAAPRTSVVARVSSTVAEPGFTIHADSECTGTPRTPRAIVHKERENRLAVMKSRSGTKQLDIASRSDSHVGGALVAIKKSFSSSTNKVSATDAAVAAIKPPPKEEPESGVSPRFAGAVLALRKWSTKGLDEKAKLHGKDILDHAAAKPTLIRGNTAMSNRASTRSKGDAGKGRSERWIPNR